VIQLDPFNLLIVHLSSMTQLPTDLNSPDTVHTGSAFCSTLCTMAWPFALPVPSSAHGPDYLTSLDSRLRSVGIDWAHNLLFYPAILK